MNAAAASAICPDKHCAHPLRLHDDVHCAGSDFCACRGIKVAKVPKVKPAPEVKRTVKLEIQEWRIRQSGRGPVREVISYTESFDSEFRADQRARKLRVRREVIAVRVSITEGDYQYGHTMKARYARVPRPELLAISARVPQ